MSGRDAPQNLRDDPVDVLRSGNVYARIWQIDTPDGPQFDMRFSVIWRDGQQQMHEFYTFGDSDLPHLQALADKARRRCHDLQREHRREQSPDAQKRMAFAQKRGGRAQEKPHPRER